jgi:hypothetical protein
MDISPPWLGSASLDPKGRRGRFNSVVIAWGQVSVSGIALPERAARAGCEKVGTGFSH